MRGSKILLAIGGLIVLIGCMGAFILPDHVEILAKGQLLSYSDGRVYHLRLFNAFELYIEPSNRLSSDVLTAYILLAMSFTSLIGMIVMLRFPSQDSLYTRTINLMLCLGLGTHYLAIDEYFGVHETIGHNLQWLRHLPGVTRPDDAIIAFYLFPALFFVYKFHRLLSACRGGLALFVSSIVLFAGSAMVDMFHLPGEEPLELLTSGLLLGSILWLVMFYVEKVIINHFSRENIGATSSDLSIANPNLNQLSGSEL